MTPSTPARAHNRTVCSPRASLLKTVRRPSELRLTSPFRCVAIVECAPVIGGPGGRQPARTHARGHKAGHTFVCARVVCTTQPEPEGGRPFAGPNAFGPPTTTTAPNSGSICRAHGGHPQAYAYAALAPAGRCVSFTQTSATGAFPSGCRLLHRFAYPLCFSFVCSLILMINSTKVGHDDRHRQRNHQHAAQRTDPAHDFAGNRLRHHVAVAEQGGFNLFLFLRHSKG